MSPQLLLVLMVALVCATFTGLLTRRSFAYLPLYWLIAVCALLIGQELGKVAGWTFLTVGDVQIGAGLVVDTLAITGLRVFSLWYTQKSN